MKQKETTSRSSRTPRRGGPVMGGGMPADKAKNFKAALGKLLRSLKPYRVALILVFLFAAASALFAIWGPKILGNATTELYEGIMEKIAGTGPGIDFTALGNILIMLIVIYLVSALFNYIQGFMMSDISMKVTYQYRKRISEKINRMPLKYFDATPQGEVLSRVTNDVETISQTLNQSLSQIISSITTIIGVLIMMLSISWLMTLIALVMLPISMLLMMTVIRRSQKYFTQQQDYLGHINGHVEEMYGGHLVVKSNNGEQRSIDTFNKMNDVLYSSAWKSQAYSGMMMPIMIFVSNLGYVAVCIVGGALAASGTITIGNIQSFIQYIRNFTQPITQIANIGNIIQQTVAAAERIFEFLEEEEESPDEQTAFPLDDIKGVVEFRNVRFGYSPDKIIIDNFSATIQPGQKIAIVGPTGAGKTTIVKLLMRFYDILDGQILIDGHDIREFSRHDLRSLFGMVLQDTWLYHASILDNIRYGRLDASEEEVIAASRSAHSHHFIKTLPDGYHMQLNEEATNISQGQKQLLTIARAMLANPRILILDEATSSVDTRTETLVQRAMYNLTKERTSFVIAHRLSTIRDADLILCMKNGDIVEQGSHEELLAKDGFYANLYRSQFESGLVEQEASEEVLMS